MEESGCIMTLIEIVQLRERVIVYGGWALISSYLEKIYFYTQPYWSRASLVAPPSMQESWVWSLGWEIPWRREWLPTPVFLPGEFQGQRSLAGYSPWGRKESDTTEWLTLSLQGYTWVEMIAFDNYRFLALNATYLFLLSNFMLWKKEDLCFFFHCRCDYGGISVLLQWVFQPVW